MATAIKRKATDLAAADAKKPKANGSITSFFGAPKPVAGSQSASAAKSDAPPAKPFDKDAWVAKLSAEQKELLKLEIDTLHDSWLPYLREVIEGKEFLDLKRFLKSESERGVKVFPPLEDVYSWYIILLVMKQLLRIDSFCQTGPGTRPSRPSRPSSSARTRTTTSTKRMACASPSDRPPRRPRRSRTCTLR